MRRAAMLGRAVEPQGRHVSFGERYYAFAARTPMECDQCGGEIRSGDVFSRPEINQRTQRFSRVYYCRSCVHFECWEADAPSS